jgi:nitrogen fixation NifU-like protein
VDALYRDYILDHYKSPRNFGELEPHDLEFHDNNPLCGDELGVHIRVEHGKVADLRFHGQGCAISQAAASIISDELKGKTVAEIADLDRHFVVDELGMELSPTRLKCGLLSLKVVQGALLGTDEWPSGVPDGADPTPEEASRLRSEI